MTCWRHLSVHVFVEEFIQREFTTAICWGSINKTVTWPIWFHRSRKSLRLAECPVECDLLAHHPFRALAGLARSTLFLISFCKPTEWPDTKSQKYIVIWMDGRKKGWIRTQPTWKKACKTTKKSFFHNLRTVLWYRYITSIFSYNFDSQ